MISTFCFVKPSNWCSSWVDYNEKQSISDYEVGKKKMGARWLKMRFRNGVWLVSLQGGSKKVSCGTVSTAYFFEPPCRLFKRIDNDETCNRNCSGGRLRSAQNVCQHRRVLRTTPGQDDVPHCHKIAREIRDCSSWWTHSTSSLKHCTTLRTIYCYAVKQYVV